MIAQRPPDNQQRSFRVSVLGPLTLEGEGVQGNPSSWSRPARSLFLFLLTASDLRRRRDEAIDALWPEAGLDAGAANLRSALFHLRQLLGGGDPSPVLFAGGWISLNPSCGWDIDLARFDALVQTAGEDPQPLEAVMALYRGEALPEERYSDWARPTRERTERVWRECSVRLARYYWQKGEQDLALAQYEKSLESDPYDETALRELLLVLTEMGRRADAIRRYERFAQLLREDLDLAPDADTQAAIAHVRAAGDSTAPVPITSVRAEDDRTRRPTGGFLGARPVSPIVGRDQEIEQLNGVADAVMHGTGRFQLITGEAGIGKTRLAQEAMCLLQERGFVVATGRCSRRLQTTVLCPIREVMGSLRHLHPSLWGQAIARWPILLQLLPDRAPDTSAPALATLEQRLDLLHAVASYLTAIGDERPVALLLDDLHWADEASLDVLQYVARETRGSRVLLLGTFRDTDLDRNHPLNMMVRELAREGLVDRDVIQRLTIEDTATVIRAVLGEIPWAEEFVDFTHRRTKGNPFYVHRMLHSLGGRYRLIRQIGRGGMGRVFEAIDLRTGERVAAKFMFARSEADPKALQRFQQEGAVLSTLKHPNIVEVHRTFLDEHACCIVMELLQGRSLRQTIRARKLELPRIKALGTEVAAALAFAHEHGVVHRDIKPDNIMLSEAGQVKVTDFGIARLLRSSEAATTMTSLGMTMGTPHYMAPEQILGQRVDGRADIYSLGAVLYELVTGRPPFEGDEPMTIAVGHVQTNPAPPSEFDPDLPNDWDALILKALAKKPADRHQSAARFMGRIASLSIPKTATAVENDSQESPPFKVRLHRGLLGAMAGAGFTLLGLAALLYATVWPGNSRHPPGGSGQGLGIPAAIFGASPGPGLQFSQIAGIAVDSAGNVYATDVGNGRVDKITPTGQLAGQWPLGIGGRTVEGGDTYEIVGPSGTIVDARGNVYVSDYPYHRIQRLAAGASTFAGWGAPGAAPGPPFGATGLARDSAGNVYSADAFNNRIYKLSRTGALLLQWGNEGSGPGELRSPGGVAVDSSHHVYVVDTGNDRIQKFSDQGVLLAVWGSSGSRPGEFLSPEGVAVDERGNIYVADTGNNRIQKLSSSGQPLQHWTTRACDTRRIPQPVDVKVAARGNIYVADGTSKCIQEFAPAGQLLHEWGRQAAIPGQLKFPQSVTVDGRGTVYVADSGHDRVQVFSPTGKPLASWGTTGAKAGQFRTPGGIVRDRRGDMYVSDTGNNRIQVLAAVTGRSKPWERTRPAFREPFSPTGLTLDSGGNVLVSDWSNGRIVTFSADGRQISTVGSKGSGPGQFLHPGGITVDPGGNVYVADEGNHRIQRISRTGSVRTWNQAGSRRAGISAPVGLVMDAQGHLFVSDTDTSRISEFAPSGALTAQWGSKGGGRGQFRSPAGLGLDSAGNLYVADAGNNRIQKFDPHG